MENKDDSKKGLTQDDFRNLINTESKKDGARTLGVGKLDRNSRGSKYGDGKTPNPYLPNYKEKKTNERKNYNRHENSNLVHPQKKSKKESETSQYRDRAAERRRGENPDYVNSEQILTNLNYTSTEIDKELAYQQSKYLGGDVEHTHLVKGLDYALLAKVRANQNREGSEEEEEGLNSDDELEEIYQKKQEGGEIRDNIIESEPATFLTGLGERIVKEGLKKREDISNNKNLLFLPGKMAYNFELMGDKSEYTNPFFVPTMVIRSAIEIERFNEMEAESKLSKLTVQKVVSIFQKKRLGTEKKPEKVVEQVKGKKEEKKENTGFLVKADSDDNIFSDVESEYSLDLDEVAKNRGVNLEGIPSDGENEVDKVSSENDKELLETQKNKIEKEDNDIINDLSNSDSEKEEEHIELRRLFESSKNKRLGPLLASKHSTELEINYGGDDSGSDINEEEDELMMDQGTNKNKKRQMGRNEFENEEEFQKYKEKQVFMPKAAYTFGVKSKDRKGKKGKGGKVDDKEGKLDKEFQRLESYMKKRGMKKG
ncbi:hypothetical protein K502DRAFT_342443 [Neoconidiobolus thromboides FSU 785]|nr:hypothetical protein K502DRAFT_342443 [Neoconidiobolus thromboides FSU 785]